MRPCSLDVTTDLRHVLNKTEVANAIAAYLVLSRPDDRPQQVLDHLMVSLGISRAYVESLLPPDMQRFWPHPVIVQDEVEPD